MAAEEKETAEESTPFDAPAIEMPAPAPAVLGFVDARRSQSLNGKWNFIVDPMGVGQPGGFFGGWATDRVPVDEWQVLEYNYAGSRKISVPGDFNTQFEDLLFYRDGVWYQRWFDVEPKPGKRYHLWFGGSNYTTSVYLNGTPMAKQVGGYVPYSIDVTDALKSGGNDLVISVNNRLEKHSVPTPRTDWWPYGGLIRDVMLIETPSAHLVNAKVELADLSGRVEGVVATQGLRAGDTVTVSIAELDFSTEVTVGSDGQGQWTAMLKPELWSPENPKLYDVEFATADEQLSDRIGFRLIEARGTEIFLNGKRIRFKGISTHEEPIGRDGAAYSKADFEALFGEAKALGANFVRAAHYPYARHAAQVADELGLMLWEEVPIYWNIAWENPETLEIAKDQITRLVTRDWNRASVVIWSVANETPYSEPRMAFLEALINEVRSLDDTRLVSAALLGDVSRELKDAALYLAAYGAASDEVSKHERDIFKAMLDKAGDHAPAVGSGFELVIDDPLGELLDVVSYNEYFGWYYARFIAPQLGVSEKTVRKLMFKFMEHVVLSAAFDKPMHISEFGAGAKSGKRGEGPWTEEYQAEVYRAQSRMIMNSPQIQGMTPWILKDFRAMLRTLPGIQDYRNRKGLIDENGQRKQAFYVLRDFYEGSWANVE
ncbi:glycoside hydrolase family 2 protein [Congregibacter litoralis]|nr:glycoside hydrolase family 2 TIM barrel-domain containing protein [Congregibacter litoralis]